MGLFGDISDAVTGGLNYISDQYWNNKNFDLQVQNLDYQKQLQQEIFNREDTSLQRRMADAEKAGLNPFSVASGSGAGAGSVVSTSAPQGNSTHLNLGNMDFKRAKLEDEQAKLNTAILKNQENKSYYEAESAKVTNTLLGLEQADRTNNFIWRYGIQDQEGADVNHYSVYDNSPQWQMWEQDLKQRSLSNEARELANSYSQKNLDWYEENQLKGEIGSGIRGLKYLIDLIRK